MQIDPKLRGKMPRVAEPIPFRAKENDIHGWTVTIPGRRPLATPALANGFVVLGGGFGSYEFYAFDAESGRLAWQYQTNDDGPTAAVVADELIAFNTESCELEVLTREGRSVWKRWLGDPLMSMPAIGNGQILIAYPDGRGDGEHYLGAFDLRSGRDLWRQRINGDIITAPVLAEGHVYLTTLDGTLYCFGQDGTPVWQDEKNATSAPVVWKGQCYFSQREEVPARQAGTESPQQTERVAARKMARRAETIGIPSTVTQADYLDYAKRSRRSPQHHLYEMADGGVGFAGHKGQAKMFQAMHNLGKGQVSAVWAHQGSKPFLRHGRLYSALGDTVHCVDAETRSPFWKQKPREHPEQPELLDSTLTPPATVNGKIFLGTLDGDVFCLGAESGEVIWSVNVGEPILCQVAVARGRVYAATQAGHLFCLETGDPADDGWLMWGAGPDHNGLVD
jgi:outer membrane protein assembly factor BamB